ncbi:hypothetical protein [Methanococcoides alaskense]|uniref:Peptidoglycan hydrolase CwlO-like protein n=1 Tax=Methanococcoides alaskense TaxID=325778 RepID=A0AA90Z600_9EURY|nr:hypothetical protein [Methanococcoides alaskense]MDA0525324.1 hypothetical protein [Methanococcoides alaskense]MDR6221750.1 peptidoglycan hydrolase CwlO-like protein [Methanococcoides alaskense]
MVSIKHLGIVAILLIGLTLSGCVGEPADNDTEEDTATADEILAEEGVELTDSEIADLENDLEEFEAQISEIEEDTELIVEEV